MADSSHSKTITASAKIATGECYLDGFIVTPNGGAGTVIFDDSITGTGTEKCRGGCTLLAGSTPFMFSKPIAFTNGIYATVTTAFVSIMWSGPAS